MKKLIKLVLVLGLIVTLFTSVYAATYVKGVDENGISSKIPSSFSYKDIERLQTVSKEICGKTTKVINATPINKEMSMWAVRIAFVKDNGEDDYINDYILTTIPYTKDVKKNEVISLPFKDIEDGCKLYGSNWYYFGLYSDSDFNTCGFCIAERVKRWVNRYNLDFSGSTFNGQSYIGKYREECSDNFLQEHINPVESDVSTEKQ